MDGTPSTTVCLCAQEQPEQPVIGHLLVQWGLHRREQHEQQVAAWLVSAGRRHLDFPVIRYVPDSFLRRHHLLWLAGIAYRIVVPFEGTKLHSTLHRE